MTKYLDPESFLRTVPVLNDDVVTHTVRPRPVSGRDVLPTQGRPPERVKDGPVNLNVSVLVTRGRNVPLIRYWDVRDVKL